jgi:acetyl esterase
MPRLLEVRLAGTAGEYMESALLVAWAVALGERVEAGALLAVVETAKAASEIRAPAAGSVEALLVEPGREVGVGSVLCRLRVEGSADAAATGPADPVIAEPSAAPQAAPRHLAVPAAASKAPPGDGDDGFVPASPIARRLAREHGLELARLPRSGADGRVREKDVLAALGAVRGAPASAAIEAIELDPQLRAVLDQAARQAAGLPPASTWSIAELRTWMDRRFGPAWNRDLPPLARIEPVAIRGPTGPLPGRLYDPGVPSPAPLLLWLHGGGWVMGGLDSHEGICRRLALAGACRVLAIAYRLAPEHRFPAALEDSMAALRFLSEHGGALGLDPRRIAVGGDSAGANLALAALLALRDGGERLPRAAVLAYGGWRRRFAGGSRARFADPYFLLPPDLLDRFWAEYLPPGHGDGADPLAEPLDADLAGLPPILIGAAGLDPLLDENRALAARLALAGVRHEFLLWPGLAHGTLHMTRALDAAVVALERLGQRLRRLLQEDPA